ncbi:MAG: DUF1501 domain-containing protein [Dehalococcoidia bacterium]|nr:DUF1501 domain-containing protein [Dehalococcoidia bacterium]
MLISRRNFLKSTATLLPAFASLPMVFRRAVASSMLESSSYSSPYQNRTLIIIQMAGGNDGLNTVIPYTDSKYYDHRSYLAVSDEDVLDLNGELGLHPVLGKMKLLWDQGLLAVVQGVGYENQSYSHFESMHIWQTADNKGKLEEGWLGRYFESLKGMEDNIFQGLAVGKLMPYECSNLNAPIPVVSSIDKYRLEGSTQQRSEALLKLYSSSPLGAPYGVLLDNTIEAVYKSSEALQTADKNYQSDIQYPETSLSKSLKVLAEAIIGDLGVRVGHVKIGGFDTHSDQIVEQPDLLQEMSEAIYAFYEDLKAAGRDQDVLIMTWSEFGRRVKSNGSGGTDHGAAAPMFLIGSPVVGGIYGENPNLRNLDKDNLRFTTDFRSVYSTVLEEWLGAAPEAILGGQRFEHIPFLAKV